MLPVFGRASAVCSKMCGRCAVLYLYVCFGFVEQAQGGVAIAVGSQGYEGLQPLQTQPQVSSSAQETQRGGKRKDDDEINHSGQQGRTRAVTSGFV